MDKALLFTDLHLTERDAPIIGLSPAQRFSDALAHALSRHPDAAHVLLLGDLTHNAAPDAYRRLTDILADCPIRVTATLGNHDRRAGFFECFPKAARTGTGHAQCALDLGPYRVLVLDTLDEAGAAPEHAGWICEERLTWLDVELTRAKADGRGVVVCCHHPPFDTGFDGMDAIKLANASALWSRLQDADLRHVICGHIHRTISLSVGGVPATVLKSTCHQMPLILGESALTDSVDEPGAYGVLCALDDTTLAVHTEDYALSTGIVESYERPVIAD